MEYAMVAALTAHIAAPTAGDNNASVMCIFN
jgi:hypothetical protein